MMIACCIPMLVIAVALFASGTVGAGFLLVAVMCTAMMALMMRAMPGDDAPKHSPADQPPDANHHPTTR